MGEIHELFVLALSLVWFAGATPDSRLKISFRIESLIFLDIFRGSVNGGFRTVALVRRANFNLMFPLFYLWFTSVFFTSF